MDDDEQISIGGVPANSRTVLAYLMHAEGGNLSEEKAKELMAKHPDELKKGQDWGSMAYYVGDEMLSAEGN